jgi:hypothetical protein
LIGELAAAVEQADLAPRVHAILLSGAGRGFCGGYDLLESADGLVDGFGSGGAPAGSAVDPAVVAANNDPEATWGITLHTPEGCVFQQQAAAEGFRAAVRGRDEPFGDAGPRSSGVTS